MPVSPASPIKRGRGWYNNIYRESAGWPETVVGCQTVCASSKVCPGLPVWHAGRGDADARAPHLDRLNMGSGCAETAYWVRNFARLQPVASMSAIVLRRHHHRREPCLRNKRFLCSAGKRWSLPAFLSGQPSGVAFPSPFPGGKAGGGHDPALSDGRPNFWLEDALTSVLREALSERQRSLEWADVSWMLN